MSALAAFAEGAPVLVGDPDDPAVFLAAPAATIDGDTLELVQKLSAGLIMLGLPGQDADRLALEPLAEDRSPLGLTRAAPVDAARGVRGGWSATDRAHTIRICADPASRPEDLTVPGHVHTARIDGHSTPAAAGALELSGLEPAAVVLAAVSDRDGAPLGLDAARAVGALRRLPHASSAELRGAALARRAGGIVECELPTGDGRFRAVALDGGTDHGSDCGAVVALVHGDPRARAAPRVHVHAGCLLGDAFGSLLCDCRAELEAARVAILAEGAGAILYIKPDGAQSARHHRCGREIPVDLAPVIALLRACGLPTPVATLSSGARTSRRLSIGDGI